MNDKHSRSLEKKCNTDISKTLTQQVGTIENTTVAFFTSLLSLAQCPLCNLTVLTAQCCETHDNSGLLTEK